MCLPMLWSSDCSLLELTSSPRVIWLRITIVRCDMGWFIGITSPLLKHRLGNCNKNLLGAVWVSLSGAIVYLRIRLECIGNMEGIFIQCMVIDNVYFKFFSYKDSMGQLIIVCHLYLYLLDYGYMLYFIWDVCY